MTDENRKSEAACQEDARTLNVADDNASPTEQSSTEGASRALHDRVRAAKTRVDIAMKYTMWSEVREALRAAQSELAAALAHFGE
jgi:hypothetical protein